MTDDPKWFYPHEDNMPCDNRAVTVLVGLKDGTFYPDIGRWYGKDGWSIQMWSGSTVVAWTNIPDFKDATPIMDHDDAVGGVKEP